MGFPEILAAPVAFMIWGYLVGSVPSGLLLTRVAGLGDVRKIGSGNIGATNVLRTGNKALAAATLLLDVVKGFVPVWLAALASFEPLPATLYAGAGAILGHMYPVWLRFKGGKGVATALGVILGFSWPAGLIVAGTWLLTAIVFRISSLAALVAAAAAPGYVWLFAGPAYAWFTGFIALMIWFRHMDNIRRLLKREEPKIGAKKG